MMRLFSLALVGVQLLTMTAALPNITRTGKYLYDESGNRFYIKGVAYQPEGELAASSDSNSANGGFPEPSSFHDPLSSPQNCTRDLPYLQQLGVNAVRVYSVNSSLNHDDCMKMLNDAGIYVLLDLSLPLNGSIDRSSPSWSTNLLNEYIETIDAFKNYENVLGYNVGNEVINLASNTNAAPFVKAAARDIKAYLKSVGSSALVGYAAVDGEPDFRNSLAEYLTCGGDSIAVDLYGLNNYEWCGNQNINSSNWNTITEGFSDLPVATYMSEFGCITSPPRLWTEVAALFASPVSDVFSGGVAFSYFPTSDNYGMVTISGNDTVTVSDDFTRLATQYNSTSPPNSPTKSSVTANETDCPAESDSLLASSTLPPTPNESVCNCINENSLSCKVKQSSANSPEIVGALLDYACSLLGSTDSSASCDPIAGNGTSGTYGQLSFCSPAIKLSYVMSTYYQINPEDTSCDFAGNASLSANRPNTVQDANAAASSCLAAEPSGGVFTPTAPGNGAATATSTGTASGSTSSGASTSDSSASTSGDIKSITVVGGLLTAVVGIVGAMVGGSAILL
ncbi:1,3-beta-glucanosyltransferase [Cryptococcus neoformans]|nr:1,3-beta-glucanosyltransferase [Cryptococcus neoformans var. grubii Bt120]OXG35015.1 1,3-beta-glucanosyltransferase [Cryptococcus neoformans var. grubii Bt15]OXG41975.1 1,3-beta-glucanosyltransferase [Cryptococcus neoformans var. grubii Th84]OXH00399.1 1,3-beta-glucanosyltransferase [Cryptococcus neoformans var. grubii]OXH21801.1 1,3-beta-glucanosyltransferase [Cryptococcus neoformans var. grubii]